MAVYFLPWRISRLTSAQVWPGCGFFQGSAHFFVPPELFSRFRLADGVRGSEQIAEDANAVGIGEVGSEFDFRGKPLLFPKLASTHNDIIASAGVISKERKLKKRL